MFGGRLPLRVLSAGLCLSAGIYGCGADGTVEPVPEPYAGPPLPWAYTPFPSVSDPPQNPSSEAKVALGRMLFYDPIVSSDKKVACATCHSEIWGMSDGLGVSVGILGVGPTGPGRVGPNITRRNAQTLWNVAFRERLFWDGRAASLEEQALLPIENELELARDIDALLADLSANETYAAMFADAFDEAPSVTRDTLAQALASFQRTMITNLAPYDRYVAGDEGALSAETRAGMFLFGEAGCASCHVPPLFESEIYADRGAPHADPLDLGRMEATKDEADREAFRVPTLRNIRETEPYFHGGSAPTLGEAVAHEAKMAAELGESRELSGREVELITVFLEKALMDRSKEPDRPETVPSGLQVPKDGFRIFR